MELRAQDEFPHTPDGEDDSPWKDTWWFVARDAETDVAVHAHLTLSANRQPPARTTVLVKHGGREALQVLRTEATRMQGDTVGNDLLQITILEPEWGDDKRIRLTAQLDEVEVELNLAGRFPHRRHQRAVPRGPARPIRWSHRPSGRRGAAARRGVDDLRGHRDLEG